MRFKIGHSSVWFVREDKKKNRPLNKESFKNLKKAIEKYWAELPIEVLVAFESFENINGLYKN